MVIGLANILPLKYLKVVLFLPFCLVPSILQGQVNISQYVDNDLFKAKPVITHEFIDQKSKDKTPISYFQKDVEIGLAYWNTGKLDDAVSHFNVMIDMYPEIGFFHYYLGAIQYDKRNYDEGIESLHKALKIDPFLLESRYLIGLIQIEMKELKKAKESMDLLLNVKKYAAYGYCGLGMIAKEEGNYFKAVRMYEKCIREDSTFLQAYIPLASIEMKVNNRFNRALDLMNTAVSIDATWQDARIFRAILSVYKAGNIDQFDKDINILIEQDPKNYHYYSIRGFLDIELQNYKGAVNNFRNALNLAIDSIDVGEQKFSTRLKHNRSIQSALNYYHDKSRLLKDSTRWYIDRGICDFIIGNNKRASTFYDSASNYEASSVVDFFNAVLCSSEWNKSDEALKYYSNSIQKDSSNYAAYVSRVELNIKRKEIHAAFADCGMMIKLEPRRKEGYKTRGSLLLQTGNYLKAYSDFTSGILLDSTDSDLFFNRATSAFNAGYYDQSIEDLFRVIQLKPKDSEAYYMLSLGKLVKEDTIGSIALLDSASKFSNYNSKYHNELRELANKHNQVKSFKNSLDRLLKYNPGNAEFLFERGKLYFMNNELEKAFKDLSKATKLNHTYADAFFYLGKTQEAMGDINGGSKSIKKAIKMGFIEGE